MILSYIATRIFMWKSNSQKTYGYVRIEIFVAFINALALVIIGGYIIYEAICRIPSPQQLPGLWIILIALIGLVMNTISTILLREDAHQNLNAKSAYLHLLTDALESLAVVAVGLLIYLKQWFLLDPIISIAIGIFVVKSAWNVLIETINILTEGTPKGINLQEVVDFTQSFPEVKDVHHLSYIELIVAVLRSQCSHSSQ